MEDIILERDELINYYRHILGPSWIHYGLEIVKTADSVLRYFVPRDKNSSFSMYARKALFHTLVVAKGSANKKNNKESSIEDLQEIHLPSTKIDTDYYILIADMEKNLTPDVVYVGLRTHLDGYTRDDFVRKTYFTDNMVRGRLKKFNDYIEQYRKER